MGLDISSKSGLSYSIGYGGFMFMRLEVVEALGNKGMGIVYRWSLDGRLMHGVEKDWESDSRGNLLFDGRTHVNDFRDAAYTLMITWLDKAGFRSMARNFLYHSDCGGHLTAAQCRTLTRDFDKFKALGKPLARSGDKFEAFCTLVKTAAERNETLHFY